jgi:hypothetical protein
VPIFRRNNCVYAILGTCYSVCVPDSHPYRITSTNCHINTVVSPDDGHSRPKHVEKRNIHTKKNCAPSWLYFTRLCRDAWSTKHKNDLQVFCCNILCTVAGLSCSIIYMPGISNGTLWAKRQCLKCSPVSGILVFVIKLLVLKKCYFARELRY